MKQIKKKTYNKHRAQFLAMIQEHHILFPWNGNTTVNTQKCFYCLLYKQRTQYKLSALANIIIDILILRLSISRKSCSSTWSNSDYFMTWSDLIWPTSCLFKGKNRYLIFSAFSFVFWDRPWLAWNLLCKPDLPVSDSLVMGLRVRTTKPV